DPLRPQLPEASKSPVTVVLDEQPEKSVEVPSLVERGVEQHDFPRPAFPRMAEIGGDLLVAEEVQGGVALWVITELALEHAAADCFQQQHFLIRGIEQPR